MSGEVVGLAFVGFAFATFWLSLYAYALFRAGKALALRYRTRVKPWWAVTLISLAAVPIALPFLALPLSPIYRFTVVFGTWLIHMQPTAVGYWSACEVQRECDEARWKQATDQWIAEFEDPAPEFMREAEDES